ncbi:MAG: tripartite tricarboxylate transporter substrate binding protein [Burkholderiales bacterium]|nr:tripartite tricarboxylate transporter substrate binding protein [Burkholderiales bacterium]
MKRKLFSAIAVIGLMQFAMPDVGAQGASAYPERPVRWIVPFPPGASNDITARLFAHKLSEGLGQQFVIDNRSGAGGSIGAQIAAEAAPDGYTLLHANPGPSVNNIIMRRKSPYQISSFAPVFFIGYSPLIIVASPKFGPNNGRELLAYAKANSGKLTWASSGNGSSLHIGLALFAAATGTDIVHVPYKGTAPALTDLMGGQVQMMFSVIPPAHAQVTNGKLRALAVTSAKRLASLPNVPTVAESGIAALAGFESTLTYGLLAPRATPAPVIAALSKQILQVAGTEAFQSKLGVEGAEPLLGDAAQYAALIKKESTKWAAVVKASGASV